MLIVEKKRKGKKNENKIDLNDCNNYYYCAHRALPSHKLIKDKLQFAEK